MDYTWNDRGELASRARTIPGSPPQGPDVIFLNGFEEATITSTENFVFDQARRLVTTFGQMTQTYDAHNHRVATVTPMTGTRYQVYSRSGDLLYIEDSGSAQRTEFFNLGGTLVAERTRPLVGETPVISYLHSDHRGTPTVKTDSNSVVNYPSRLMPYGVPYDGIWREGPGFTKHATDEDAQLSYMQQRYYDPVSMRFLSPDPVAAGVNSFNVYAYANNNPYTFVDPDGRLSCQPVSKCFPITTINVNSANLRRRVSDGPSRSGYESVQNEYLRSKMKFVGGPDGRSFSATDLTMSYDSSIAQESAEAYASLASNGWTVNYTVDGKTTSSSVGISVSRAAPNLASGGSDLHLSPCIGGGCAQYGQAILGGRVLFLSPGQLQTTPAHEVGHIFGLGHDSSQMNFSGTIMSRSFNRSVTPTDINRLFELYGK